MENTGNNAPERENAFTAPIEDLASATKEYVDIRVDEAKLGVIDVLSNSLGRFLAIFALVQLTIVALLLLCLASVLVLGELIGSYALSAVIVAAGFILLGILLYILFKGLFVRVFGSMLSSILFSGKSVGNVAVARAELRSRREAKESEISLRGKYLRSFYSLSNLYNFLLGKVAPVVNFVTFAVEIYEKIVSRRAARKAAATAAATDGASAAAATSAETRAAADEADAPAETRATAAEADAATDGASTAAATSAETRAAAGPEAAPKADDAQAGAIADGKGAGTGTDTAEASSDLH